jgi:hypothetical protein
MTSKAKIYRKMFRKVYDGTTERLAKSHYSERVLTELVKFKPWWCPKWLVVGIIKSSGEKYEKQFKQLKDLDVSLQK